MCGIVGVLQLDGRDASDGLARKMADALAHRGPDGEGAFAEGPLAFGHRRLAVIDPTPGGDQPMTSRDGRFVLNYNGEVYNFPQLRHELERHGHRFGSRSDTEVVLQSLTRWGVDALHRFNGMFALSLWDREEEELLLARDRYGVKPLYHCRLGDQALVFASEIKAFLIHPAFRAVLDPEALVEYLTFQNIFTSKTLFAGVQLLPSGTFAKLRPDSATVKPIEYWDFDFAEADSSIPAEDFEEELSRLFQQAVSRQLISDTKISSYLSGGVDSGSITAVASRHVDHLQTFTVGFDLSSVSGIEASWDERAQAEHLSYLLGTEQYEMVLKAGDMERAMTSLVWHLEDLRVGQSYPNFYAAKLASRFGKVVLSGTGGDEVFGGYPWRYYRSEEGQTFEQFVDAYYLYWQRLVDNSVLHRITSPIRDSTRGVWTRDIMAQVFPAASPVADRAEDFINRSLYFEAKTFLPGLLLVEDKLSMAHGLETRVPFLDNDLVDFAMRVPVRYKLGNLGPVHRMDENEPLKREQFYLLTGDGKLILRQVMGRLVPEEVSGRRKQGFSAPDASWFRGESIDYVRRLLLSPDALVYEYLDRDSVQQQVQQHLDGRANKRLLIWSLICLEQWCRTFLIGGPDMHPVHAPTR